MDSPSSVGEAEAQRLKLALRAEIDRTRVDLRELSARTGRSEGYWSQVFQGRVAFRVDHVFTALHAIGAAPDEFFAQFYGGAAKSAPGETIEEAVLRTLRRLGISASAAEAKP